jgi:hypothetical protein
MLSWAVMWTLTMMAVTPAVWAQAPPPPRRSTPPAASRAPVISSRQIDRYDAIKALQQRLKENPKSLADWVILGELAHEVAMDLPTDQAPRYYQISRDAYEKALALQPDHPGLKAALQFARDHEANSARFESARHRAAQTYLDARRRDLAAAEYTPSLPLYGVPQVPPVTVAATTTVAPNSTTTTVAPTTTNATTTTVTPTTTVTTTRPTTPPESVPTSPAAGALPDNVATIPGRNAAAAIVAADRDPVIEPAPKAQADIAGYGARQFFSTSIPPYQPYYTEGVPYTYQRYSSAYYPANLNNTPTPPITAQRYYYPSVRYQPVPPVPGP